MLLSDTRGSRSRKERGSKGRQPSHPIVKRGGREESEVDPNPGSVNIDRLRALRDLSVKMVGGLW